MVFQGEGFFLRFFDCTGTPFGVMLLAAVILCCGGDFATTSTARSKRTHASGRISEVEVSLLESLAMTEKLPPMTIYANLMEEARFRIEAMNAALSGRLPLPDMILEEFIYLQIRLLCEIVALGCLVAHGDFTQDQLTKLRDTYDADTIIKNLTPLSPHFSQKLLG